MYGGGSVSTFRHFQRCARRSGRWRACRICGNVEPGRSPAAAVVQVTAPPPAPAAPAAERVLSANPLWAMPLAQFPATRERPIFSPSRRPPAAAVAPVMVPKVVAVPKPREPERPQLTLVGTIASDEEGFGIFLDQSSKADDPSKSRRGLSGLEAAIGSGPGNGARKG